MAITSADVARVAGVSRATVSYVLNAVPGKTITPATRSRVLAAADELGYRPNVMARSLKRGRTDTIVLPLPGLQLSHTTTALLRMITELLAQRGLKVVPDFSVCDDPRDQVAGWMALAPAGVIDIMLRRGDPALALLRETAVPILSAALPEEQEWESTGDRLAREQRELQLRHLLDQGHRRILVIRPREIPVDPRVLRTFERAMRALAKRHQAVVETETLDLHEVASSILSREVLPDAIACNNDDYAVVVLTALQRRGIQVPEQVAVMGVDDLPIAALVTPAITTVRVDLQPYARAIAEAVDAHISGRAVAARLAQVGQVLVRRESA